MNWYYADAGQPVGPLAEEQLLPLVESGKIQPDTLVWHDGMGEWQPYGVVRPGSATAPPISPATAAAPLSVNEVVCVECGKIVPRENAIAYGGNWVCANCKPVYFQKLKEGASLPVLSSQMSYAGFWIRFVAKFVDGLVVGAAIAIPAVILAVIFLAQGGVRGGNVAGFATSFGMGLQLLISLGSIIVTLLYNWFFLSRYSATLGKMACGLTVVDSTGAAITSGQALGRSAAEIISRMICCIGYIMVAFDREKRALHDHMANTRVIKK